MVLLSLVNKGSALGLQQNCRGTELGGENKTEGWEEKGRVRESCHGAARVRHDESLPVSHCHVAIYRSIEMG